MKYIVFLTIFASGCAMPGGVFYAAKNAQCPETLLESIDLKMDKILEAKWQIPLNPVPSQ
jgi:hypothetical protein